MPKILIDIPNETYQHFIKNEYSRMDVIALHTAIIHSKEIDWNEPKKAKKSVRFFQKLFSRKKET